MKKLRKIVYPLIIIAALLYIIPWKKFMTEGYWDGYMNCQATDFSCLYERAASHNNPYICSLLDPGQRDVCYFKLIETQMDKSRCVWIEISYYKDLCLGAGDR